MAQGTFSINKSNIDYFKEYLKSQILAFFQVFAILKWCSAQFEYDIFIM